MNQLAFAHRSFTAPFTASGRAALVAAPPWHYAGWLLNVAFRYDGKEAGQLTPPVGKLSGRGTVHFADWQACTDGHELLDPVIAQYRETIVVLEIERSDGTLCNYCPAIWVDQDISLVRGLLQGWPKKIGSTWLTRSLPLDHPAAAPLRVGSQLGASLAVKDRRLFEAEARLTGEPGRPLGFLQYPTIGAVGWPDLRKPEQLPSPVLVVPEISARVGEGWHAATASLRVFAHPGEEMDLLGNVQTEDASAGWIGITVGGARDA
ncbi:acetoacetate decarboxylase family protein [Acidovorax sp. Root402]|uniref:acetoacetate decarboxylase family protein n=1 Tax=Acidovorax sp. Root402 TaxID=1736527 RepID=UPI0006FBE07F|nr:acetoacetate decarboxylase family protein [Acidovorax sp. Root402]KQW27367.1 acetoacetate decarboxylase [Acidovorax sp. Root402]